MSCDDIVLNTQTLRLLIWRCISCQRGVFLRERFVQKNNSFGWTTWAESLPETIHSFLSSAERSVRRELTCRGTLDHSVTDSSHRVSHQVSRQRIYLWKRASFRRDPRANQSMTRTTHSDHVRFQSFSFAGGMRCSQVYVVTSLIPEGNHHSRDTRTTVQHNTSQVAYGNKRQ